MAKRENFYRRDPGAALAGMAGMSLEERGVYNTVIDLLYLTWRPIEDNRAYIAAHCGCAVQKLNPILARLIASGKLVQFDEGGQTYISNPRFEEERTAVKGAAESRSGRGQVGEKSASVEEKSAGVGEKSPGVEENPPSCRENVEENPPDTALEKSRVDKSRENIVVGQEADPPPDQDLIDTAVGLWNITANRCDLPEVRKLDEARRKRLRQRLTDGGLDDWRRALAAIERSRLCRGMIPGKNGAAPWRCNFDFLTSAAGYRKVLEGNYQADIDPPAAVVATQQSPDDLWRRRLSELHRNLYWADDWGPKPGRPGCRVPVHLILADASAITAGDAA